MTVFHISCNFSPDCKSGLVVLSLFALVQSAQLPLSLILFAVCLHGFDLLTTVYARWHFIVIHHFVFYVLSSLALVSLHLA